jgi:hypothetical protein
MAIVEKYEAFLNYAYPKIQNCPRKHGVVRDAVLAAARSGSGFYAAGQIRPGVAPLRARCAAGDDPVLVALPRHQRPKVLNTHQAAESLKRLNEVGRMLGAWIGKLKGGSGK